MIIHYRTKVIVGCSASPHHILSITTDRLFDSAVLHLKSEEVNGVRQIGLLPGTRTTNGIELMFVNLITGRPLLSMRTNFAARHA